jgi:mercuric ion transport protein
MTESCCEPTQEQPAAMLMIESPKGRSGQRVALAGGILGAIGAASCCVIPFALFSAGVSGAWIGNLTALEPYQPLFAAGALGFIGYGAYRLYANRKAACAPGSYCATPLSNRLAVLGLVTATLLVVGAVTFPYAIRAIVF